MKKQFSSKRIIGFLFGLWRISPWLVSIMLVAQTIGIVIGSTIAPIFLSNLLNNIASGNASLSSSIGLLVGYAITLVIGEIILFRIAIALAYITESKMQAVIDMRILKHLTSKSIGFHSNRMSGGVVSDVNKLVGSIERFWDTILWDVLPTIITIISVTIALSFIFWQFAIAIVLLSTIVIGIIVWSQTKIMPISNELAERSSQRTAYLSDVISNISAVKAFAQEKHEMKHFKKIVDDWRDADIREMKGVIVVTAVFSATMSILNVSAFIAAIFAMQYHLGNVGMIYLIITYTLNVSKQVWDVAGSTRSFIRIVGDAGPMIETLDSEPELKDPKFPQPSKINDGKIEFIDVDFTHDNNDDSLFNKFTLCIKPGEKIGLVGSSGSGKTSLTRLLLRFSDVDSGKILIDGQDIRDITQKDLHRCIAYVPQEPVLFHRTLQENIAYGKPKASLAEIKEAAKQANALDFIEVLKDKFETLVGERGIKLSGGQRQRIAIARAILKDAPILVLDEATSALDSETEALIQQALEKLMRNRTSIVIAHRLSTIAKLDRIVVMEEGKIIEQGSHEELIDKKGIYASLWSRQSGGFIKD